jgi:hypothetical protein
VTVSAVAPATGPGDSRLRVGTYRDRGDRRHQVTGGSGGGPSTWARTCSRAWASPPALNASQPAAGDERGLNLHSSEGVSGVCHDDGLDLPADNAHASAHTTTIPLQDPLNTQILLFVVSYTHAAVPVRAAGVPVGAPAHDGR